LFAGPVPSILNRKWSNSNEIQTRLLLILKKGTSVQTIGFHI